MRFGIGASLILVLLACDKDRNEEVGTALVSPCGHFTGIHMRDANAATYAETDTTDWTWKDDWCNEAEALFADRPSVTLDTTPPDSLDVRCFKNPISPTFYFQVGFYRDDTSHIDLRIVNEQFARLYSADSITGYGCSVPRDTLPPEAPQIVRVYYRVVHANGTAHRGHGDVLIDY